MNYKSVYMPHNVCTAFQTYVLCCLPPPTAGGSGTKNCRQERNCAIISKCPDTQEILLESKIKQNKKRSTMKSLFLVSCKQTAGKRVKEETGNFYWKQLYLLVRFTKLASIFKPRVGVPFVYGWESLVLIYPLPGGLG